jgi:hypothetical protein
MNRLEDSIYFAVKNNKKVFTYGYVPFDLSKVDVRKHCKDTLEISLKQIRNNMYYGGLHKAIIEETIMKLDNLSL